MLGRKDIILELMKEIDFDDDVEILDPKSDDQNEILTKYARIYWSHRKRKGVTLYAAQKLMRERKLFCFYDGK